jgi:protein subunit release factor A
MRSEDLEIQTVASRPPGGQSVGLVPTSVRVKHKPTGLIASCGIERSQMKNRNVAMAMIEYGLVEIGYREFTSPSPTPPVDSASPSNPASGDGGAGATQENL